MIGKPGVETTKLTESSWKATQAFPEVTAVSLLLASEAPFFLETNSLVRGAFFMSQQEKKPGRFKMERLEERITPSGLGSFCGSGSHHGSSHGSKKGSHKGSSKKGHGKGNNGYGNGGRDGSPNGKQDRTR